MTNPTTATGSAAPAAKRYRLPGIEREGIAQLSLLETALWPLQGGTLPANQFQTHYDFTTPSGRTTATVTVRAALGLQPTDELILWGLLGATLRRTEPEPVLLATPYWMLKHLGLDTGGYQYGQLRESLLRLAVASYHNTGFYNPASHEREEAAFQFLSMLLPTVHGEGRAIDTEGCWRIEWNPTFYQFACATGGNLLFDLELYRALTPASRRLFLKLKDRFWRSKKVFFGVEDLTTNGLGFAAERPLKKRKHDLLNCIRELLDHRVLELGRGQADPKSLFWKRGVGSYSVCFYEGEYFRQPMSARVLSQKNAIADDPLYEPLRAMGVDGSAITRLFRDFSHSLIQRWVRITDAALHEQPRGFAGFRVSPAAFLIDGVQHNRTPPDWMHAHEKRQRERQWQEVHARTAPAELELRRRYDQERDAALQTYLASPDGRERYKQTFPILLAVHKLTDPHRCHKTAHDATVERIERMDFTFPDFDAWTLSHAIASPSSADAA